jgi:hypothetical protein
MELRTLMQHDYAARAMRCGATTAGGRAMPSSPMNEPPRNSDGGAYAKAAAELW